MAEIGLRQFTESDAEALTAFLAGNDWQRVSTTSPCARRSCAADR